MDNRFRIAEQNLCGAVVRDGVGLINIVGIIIGGRVKLL
jgi:hypothetical protein